jgi:hypothetical protein
MKIRPCTAFAILICLAALPAVAQDAGTIVFAGSAIDPADPAGLADTFAAGDAIHGMAYFDKSLLGLEGRDSAEKVDVEVFLYELKPPLYDYQDPSEVQLDTGTLSVSGSALEHDFLPVDIVPGPDAMTAYGHPEFTYRKFGPKFDGPVKFAEKLAALEPGEHTIVVKINCNYNFVAEGRFTLSGDDYSVFNARAEELNEAASGLKTKDTVMPPAAMSDPALEREMIAAFEGSRTYQDRIKGEVLRINIIDPEWMIRRHEISGAILHRYIRAAIAVKNSDGSCTLWNLVTFQQDYVSDAFQKTRFDGVGDPVTIPCENVRK